MLILTRTSRVDQYLHRSIGGETIVIWPLPALSVNGLFTETGGIMAWAGQEDGGAPLYS